MTKCNKQKACARLTTVCNYLNIKAHPAKKFDKTAPDINSGGMYNQEECWLLKEKYNHKPNPEFAIDCQRLKAGEPLAYVIGYVNFLNCQIWLDSRPLIPRVETEYWVELLIKELKKINSTSPLRVLDLCAGSGCIGVAIAKAMSTAIVDFIELDPTHITTIEKNCRVNNLPKDQVRIMVSNLFENLEQAKQYDFIVSNPPYIDPALKRTEVSVTSFEPHLALYGGAGGLELIRTIIKTAPHRLKEKGQLWLEHEPEQAQIIKTLGDTNFTTTTLRDQYQVERFSQLVIK